MADPYASYRSWYVANLEDQYHKVNCLCSAMGGSVVLSCDARGVIAIFSLEKFLSASHWLTASSPKVPTSFFHFKASSDPIMFLQTTKDFIISGTSTTISFWKWNEIPSMQSISDTYNGKSKLLQVTASNIFPVSAQKIYLSPLKDSLWYIDNEGSVFSISLKGKENSKARPCRMMPNLPCAKATSLLLSTRLDSILVGYSDEFIRIWKGDKIDIEMHENQIKDIKIPFNDYMNEYMTNIGSQKGMASVGKGNIICMAVDRSGDWLAVGTSRNYISIWNISIMAFTKTIALIGKPSSILFDGTDLLVGGVDEYIYRYNINGDFKVRMATSSSSISDMLVNGDEVEQEKYRVLLSCGYSSSIDVFSNFTHKSFSLRFPKMEKNSINK